MYWPAVTFHGLGEVIISCRVSPVRRTLAIVLPRVQLKLRHAMRSHIHDSMASGNAVVRIRKILVVVVAELMWIQRAATSSFHKSEWHTSASS